MQEIVAMKSYFACSRGLVISHSLQDQARDFAVQPSLFYILRSVKISLPGAPVPNHDQAMVA